MKCGHIWSIVALYIWLKRPSGPPCIVKMIKERKAQSACGVFTGFVWEAMAICDLQAVDTTKYIDHFNVFKNWPFPYVFINMLISSVLLWNIILALEHRTLWRRRSDWIMACTICTTDSRPTYCLRDYCIVKFFIWSGNSWMEEMKTTDFTFVGKIIFSGQR